MTVRVLMVAHDAEQEGVPIGLLRIVQGLAADPEVAASALFLEDGPTVASVAELVPTAVLGPAGGRGAADLVALGLAELGGGALARRLRRTRVRRVVGGPWDVVYLAGAAAFAVLDGLPLAGARVLGHVHELEVGLDRSLAAGDQHLLGFADRYVATTPGVAALLEHRAGVSPDQVVVMGEVVPDVAPAPVRSSAELRADLGVGPDVAVVGAMGSLIPRKGPDLFVQLGLRLRTTGRDVHLVWVGAGGPEAAWVEREVAAAGLTDRLHLVGGQPEPYDWHRLFDVLVVPSREDTQPLVALEAAQVGTPVVAFAQGGLPDLLGHGDRGSLVPPLDGAALADAVVDVLEHPRPAAARADRLCTHVTVAHASSAVVPRLRDEVLALAGGEPGVARR